MCVQVIGGAGIVVGFTTYGYKIIQVIGVPVDTRGVQWDFLRRCCVLAHNTNPYMSSNLRHGSKQALVMSDCRARAGVRLTKITPSRGYCMELGAPFVLPCAVLRRRCGILVGKTNYKMNKQEFEMSTSTSPVRSQLCQ